MNIKMPEKDEVEKKVITDEHKQECIVKLRKLLTEQEKFKKLHNDDAYLERYLYGTDFDVEAAFDKMKMFYELLLEYPGWFSQPVPLEKKSIIDKDIRIMLPECDKEGRPIYIVKLSNVNVDTMDILDVVSVDDIWLESIIARDPRITAKGLSIVLDIANYPWKMMKWNTPENIKLSVKKVQSLPFKDFRFHIVNKSFIIHAVLKIVWPFLPARLKEMIKFHFDDWNSFHEHIDQAALPPEYRGTNNIDYNEIYSKLFERNQEIASSFKLYRSIVDKN